MQFNTQVPSACKFMAQRQSQMQTQTQFESTSSRSENCSSRAVCAFFLNQSECIQASFARQVSSSSADELLSHSCRYKVGPTTTTKGSTAKWRTVNTQHNIPNTYTHTRTHWLHSHTHIQREREQQPHTSILTVALLVGITFLSWANWVLSIFEFSTKSGSGWLCRRKRKHSHYSA